MKTTLLILALFLSLTLQAQKRIKYEPWKVIGLYTAQIAFNAIGDGLNDSGNKPLGHAFNAAAIGTAIATPFILDINKKAWPAYFVSYGFIRFATFDYVYNRTRNLPLGYLGNSAATDRLFNNFPARDVLYARSIFLTAGIAVTFDFCHKKRYIVKDGIMLE